MVGWERTPSSRCELEEKVESCLSGEEVMEELREGGGEGRREGKDRGKEGSLIIQIGIVTTQLPYRSKACIHMDMVV